MPKYRGKQIFSLGSFPEVGQKQKTEKILQGLGVAKAAVTECWPCFFCFLQPEFGRGSLDQP